MKEGELNIFVEIDEEEWNLPQKKWKRKNINLLGDYHKVSKYREVNNATLYNLFTT
jgi:hypothetical protein